MLIQGQEILHTKNQNQLQVYLKFLEFFFLAINNYSVTKNFLYFSF